ncbi:MAG: hypothetical protein LBS05_08550 [Tannerellaceae bacterium]|jgi:hypothetical protein|nr:hypothetical protein [Tannerellaceae bacterium]
MRNLCLLILAALLAWACGRPAEDVSLSDEQPPLYPDYAGVTIPCNIAPLNFLLRNRPEAVDVLLKGASAELRLRTGYKVCFPPKKWRAFLNEEQGHTVSLTITVRIEGRWIRYAPFSWQITADRIDPYLSYRLIEPGYEVWNAIQLKERHLESFDERVIADNNLTQGACMNCHVYGNQDPALSFFHIRGARGGTILNRGGRLRKLTFRTEEMISPIVYGALHPLGRYGVFSTNVIVPAFHTLRGKQMEVYDTASDLVVFDFDTDRIIPFPSDTSRAQPLRSFPVFSASSDAVYYCEAPATSLPDSIHSLRYSLLRTPFDARNGSFGGPVDTLVSASATGLSVCHPKASPDGRYLMYTVAAYGAFPIWHTEAGLEMIDLESGEIHTLPQVNAPGADSYHSWSSGSRWFVFASRRDDGLYTKPYFAYIDSAGVAHKPFLLPQRDPTLYDHLLHSFNIPELSKGPLPFTPTDIERLYRK